MASMFKSSFKDSWTMRQADLALLYLDNMKMQYKNQHDVVLHITTRIDTLQELVYNEDILGIRRFLNQDDYLTRWRKEQDDLAKPVIDVDSSTPTNTVNSMNPVIDVDTAQPVIGVNDDMPVVVIGSRNGVDFRRTFHNKNTAYAWAHKMKDEIVINDVVSKNIDVNKLTMPIHDVIQEDESAKYIATYLIKVPKSTEVGVDYIPAQYFMFKWDIPADYGVATPTALGTAINKDPIVKQLQREGFTGHPTIVAGWDNDLHAEYKSALQDLKSGNNWTREHASMLRDKVRTLGAAINIIQHEQIINI